jgi:DNA-binding response OmpR family regulator
MLEDDENLATVVTDFLETQGFLVKRLTGGKRIMKEIADFQPDVILLDVFPNDSMTGFEIAEEIRLHHSIPIIFTTDAETAIGISNVFDISYADYVRKPYRTMEIVKRIERILTPPKSDRCFCLGEFIFYIHERMLKNATRTINLNYLESAVLVILCENQCHFISRDDIIGKVWHVTDPKIKERSLNNILYNLRKYLQEDTLIEIECKNKLGIKLSVKSV